MTAARQQRFDEEAERMTEMGRRVMTLLKLLTRHPDAFYSCERSELDKVHRALSDLLPGLYASGACQSGALVDFDLWQTVARVLAGEEPPAQVQERIDADGVTP